GGGKLNQKWKTKWDLPISHTYLDLSSPLLARKTICMRATQLLASRSTPSLLHFLARSSALLVANTPSKPPWPLSTERRCAAATAHLCSRSSHPCVRINLLYLLEEQEHQDDHYTESNSRITLASSPTNDLGFTVKFVLYVCSTSELFFPVLLDVHTYHAGVRCASLKLQNQRVHHLVHCSELKTSPNFLRPPSLVAGHLPMSPC
ncbi:hypothetical protein EJB05_53760, partial [Eragrostis curvula]